MLTWGRRSRPNTGTGVGFRERVHIHHGFVVAQSQRIASDPRPVLAHVGERHRRAAVALIAHRAL
jgi:hypothetical protein